MASLHQLLSLLVEKKASDLHLTVGSPPQLRLDGSLVPLKAPPLGAADVRQLCYSVLTEVQKQKLEEDHELDMSFGIKDLARFRAAMFFQRGAIAAVFRVIPYQVQTFEELGLPASLQELAERPQGLILVTGPTGSGKSTTLAAIIDKINRERHEHILTVEDPIEYLHSHKKSIINQREVGADTHAFARALRSVLRQDPDVVLIGEMRDAETTEATLKISETGHLCLATLHTNGSVQTINRILDIFPAHQQNQVRAQLSFVLEAVISQQLIPRSDGAGRALALEVMIATPAIRNLIREDKIHQIYSQMQVGQTRYNMQTMNQSLYALVQRRLISSEVALRRSTDPDELRTMFANGPQSKGGQGGLY
jgi:twitching motility protein PilT